MSSKQLAKCPVCGSQMRESKIQQHCKKSHSIKFVLYRDDPNEARRSAAFEQRERKRIRKQLHELIAKMRNGDSAAREQLRSLQSDDRVYEEAVKIARMEGAAEAKRRGGDREIKRRQFKAEYVGYKSLVQGGAPGLGKKY